MARARGSRPPRQGDELLDGMFRRLGLTEQARGWRAMAAWARVAGSQLGSRSRAERLRGGTLQVRVSSASWAQQLGFLKASLLEKLHHTPGGESVTDLRFTIGPLSDVPAFDDPHSNARSPSTPARGPLPPNLPEHELRRALATVSDPELREHRARSRRRRS